MAWGGGDGVASPIMMVVQWNKGKFDDSFDSNRFGFLNSWNQTSYRCYMLREQHI